VHLRWPRAEQTRHRSLLDFAGHCWLWRLSNFITVAAVALGLPIKRGQGDLGFFQLIRSNSSPEAI